MNPWLVLLLLVAGYLLCLFTQWVDRHLGWELWDTVTYRVRRVVCRVLGRHTRACRGRFDHLAGSGY